MSWITHVCDYNVSECSRVLRNNELILSFQVVKAMKSVRAAGVDVMTLGQYMRPTKRHMPVSEFVTPEAFEEYRKLGVELVRF